MEANAKDKRTDTLPDFLFSLLQTNDDCFAGHLEQMNENRENNLTRFI